MSAITIGYKRTDGSAVLLKGTEVSESDQRAYIRSLGKGSDVAGESDTYEKVELWRRGIPAKVKWLRYSQGTKPVLRVTVNDKSISVGDNIPVFSATITGWTDGDGRGKRNVTGTLAFECEYTPESPAGQYTVTASGLSSNKYQIQYVNGTLTANA